MHGTTNELARIFLLLLAVSSGALAASPSKEAIYSCLVADSVAPSVRVTELPTKEINVEDDYRAGYDAKFFIRYAGKDIGYAQKGNRAAIIYSGRLYTLTSAQPLLGTTEQPSEFDPYLGEWSQVSDRTGRYLCVSFPTGILGQSGGYQKVRSGYLLAINEKRARTLYFAIANTDHYVKR